MNLPEPNSGYKGIEEANLASTQTKLVQKLILKTIQYLREPSKSSKDISVISQSLSSAISSLSSFKMASEGNLSKLHRAIALVNMSSGNYKDAFKDLKVADDLQRGYLYGDDQHIERASLLCDTAACSAFLGDLVTAERQLRRALYMVKRTYNRNSGIIAAIEVNLSEIHLLKGDTSEAKKLLNDCCLSLVESDGNLDEESLKGSFSAVKDMFGQEMRFVLYCNLIKAELLSNHPKMNVVEDFLSTLSRLFFSGVNPRSKSDSFQAMAMHYHSLLALKALKQEGSFEEYQLERVKASYSARATNSREASNPYKAVLTSLEDGHIPPQGVIVHQINNKKEKTLFVAPSGFFVGSFLDVLSHKELQNIRDTNSTQYSLDGLFK